MGTTRLAVIAMGLWVGTWVASGCEGGGDDPASCETKTDCETGGPGGTGGSGGGAGASGSGGGIGGGGDGGAGGSGGGDSGVSIPPGTTTCQLDAAGCLVSTGDESCSFALAEMIAGTSATVMVRGVLADAMDLADVTVFAFGLDANPSPLGAMCSLSRQGTNATASLADNFIAKGSETWTIASGDYAFSVECTFDNTGMGSAQMSVDGDGAPAMPLASGDMGTQNHADIIVTVRDATVCAVAVAQP